MKLVYVIMTTYNREKSAKATLKGLVDHLKYPNLKWIIADDGSGWDYQLSLRDYLSSHTDDEIHITNANRKGVGCSKNLALRKAFAETPYVFLLEDDWVLDSDLDLVPHVKAMEENTDVGMIRFGYLSTGLSMEYVGRSGVGYLKLIRNSFPYVYSGQVSLRKKSWYDAHGFHKEGVSPGEEELDFCFRFNAGDPSWPDIFWPANIPVFWGPFKHMDFGISLNHISPEG